MNNLGKRVLLLILGFLMIGSAVGMLRVLDLGIDPFGAMVIGLAHLTGIGFGTVMMILQVLIFGLIIVKNRELTGIGTVIGMLGIGHIIEFFYELINAMIQIEFTLAFRVAMLIMTLLVLSFGVALTMVAKLGLMPYDALGLVIQATTNGKLKFNVVRMGTDGFSVMIGFLLGATFGIATLMTVCVTGQLVNVFKVKISAVIQVEPQANLKIGACSN